MSRQRIDLGDARHGRREGRSDGTSRADQIAGFHGLVHQHLRRPVHDGVTVVDDGVEFFIQSGADHIRQRRSVHGRGPLLADVAQILLGSVDVRRVLALRHRLHRLDHIRDLVGVGDDHFEGFLLAQVREFVQHLLRGTEVETLAALSVLEVLACHNDAAVEGFLLVEVMGVAGGHDRLAQFLTEGHDSAVVILQHLFIGGHAACDHEPVVDERLYLQIVVIRCNLLDLLLRLSRPDGAVQFARLAGGAEQKPFPVRVKDRPRNPRPVVEVVDVGF